jgi:copper oxidase (laccase) domain-containing protein
MAVPSQELLAWLGPAIGQKAFEVGGEVRAAFLAHDPAARECFSENPHGRWQADLYQLAQQRLTALGLTRIHGGGWCTYTDQERFFSYRRDGQCGRMAALIWLTP